MTDGRSSEAGLRAPKERAAPTLRAPAAALALSLALLGVWLATGSSPRAPGATSVMSDVNSASTQRDAPPPFDPGPFLLDAERRNAQAVERAIADLHERFEGFRAGAPAFAQDMASWGTRLRVLGRGGADWWIGLASGAPEQSDRVRTYVREKFERRVLSPAALEDAVAGAVGVYGADLESSRNTLWVMVSSRTLPGREPEGPGALGAAMRTRESAASLATNMTASHAQRTLGAGLAALGVSTAGSIIAEQVAAASLARVGASLAASAGAQVIGAGAAGAAGASVGAGASTGSIAGPAGVIVGVGVGLIVGVAIDWWMTERFEARLTQEVLAYLDRVEHELIEGPPSGGGAGLRAALLEGARRMNESQRAAVLAAVSESEQ